MTDTNTVANAVSAALNMFGYKHWMNAAKTSAVFDIVTKPDARWRTQALIYEESGFVEFNIFVTDDLFPASKVQWVAELAVRATDQIPHGAFIFRHSESDTRYRVVRSFGPDPVSIESIVHLLECSAFPLEIWKRSFAYVHQPAVTPTLALQAALISLDADESGAGFSRSSLKKILRMTETSEISRGSKALHDQPPQLSLVK